MKITNQNGISNSAIEQSSQVSTAKSKELKKNTASEKSIKSNEPIEISDKAGLMKLALDTAKIANNPAVKTADLKKKIQEGSYKVEADKVADKIIEDHFTHHFGKNNL